MRKKHLQKSPRHTDAAMMPLADLQERMNKIFEDTWSRWPGQLESAQGGFMPRIETSETKKKVFVSAEVPGMNADDVKITLSPNADYLTISGEKSVEQEDKDEDSNFYQFERSYGAFRRNVPLPCTVDAEKIKAKLKNGVLKVTMEKRPSEHLPGSRDIRIEA